MTAPHPRPNTESFLHQAVDNAVAHQCFEGVELPPEMIDDLERLVEGELTVQQVIQNIHNRI